MINSWRDRFTEASAGVVIPHLLQQNDVRINRPENICRCSYPLRLYFRRASCAEPFGNHSRFQVVMRTFAGSGIDRVPIRREETRLQRATHDSQWHGLSSPGSRGRYFDWRALMLSDNLDAPMRCWEIIADDLSKAGWSRGCVVAVDGEGMEIWIVDAHRDDGKRFIARSDEN